METKKLTLRLSSQTAVPNARSLEYFDKHRHFESAVFHGIHLAEAPRRWEFFVAPAAGCTVRIMRR